MAMRRATAVGFVVALSCLGASSLAAAQTTPDPTTATPAAQPANQDMAATVRTENGRRVYVASTTIEVRGEIQRPYAFSVSGRSSLGYSYFEAPVHFIREIVDAVRRAPF